LHSRALTVFMKTFRRPKIDAAIDEAARNGSYEAVFLVDTIEFSRRTSSIALACGGRRVGMLRSALAARPLVPDAGLPDRRVARRPLWIAHETWRDLSSALVLSRSDIAERVGWNTRTVAQCENGRILRFSPPDSGGEGHVLDTRQNECLYLADN
jgi:hypothetical protein